MLLPTTNEIHSPFNHVPTPLFSYWDFRWTIFVTYNRSVPPHPLFCLRSSYACDPPLCVFIHDPPFFT